MSDTPEPKKAPNNECLGWARTDGGRKCERTISAERRDQGCLTCGDHLEYENALQNSFNIDQHLSDSAYHQAFFKNHFPKLFEPRKSSVRSRLAAGPVRVELSLPQLLELSAPQIGDLAQQLASKGVGAAAPPGNGGLPGNPAGPLKVELTAPHEVRLSVPEISDLAHSLNPPPPPTPPANATGEGGGTSGSGGENKPPERSWNLKDIAGLTTIFGVVLLGLAAVANFVVYDEYDVQYFLLATRTDHLQAAFELGPWLAVPIAVFVLSVFLKDLSFICFYIASAIFYIICILIVCFLFAAISIVRIPFELVALVPWLGGQIRGAVLFLGGAFDATHAFVGSLISECRAMVRGAKKTGGFLLNVHFLDFLGWMSHRAGPFIAFAATAIAAALMAGWKISTIDSHKNGYVICSKPLVEKQPVKLLGRISNYTIVRYNDDADVRYNKDEKPKNYIIPTDAVHSLQSAPAPGVEITGCPRNGDAESPNVGVAAYLFDQRDHAVRVKPAAVSGLNFFYFVDGEPVALGAGRFALPIFPPSVRAKFITDDRQRREFGAQGDWPGVDSVAKAYAFGLHYKSTLNYTTPGYKEEKPVDFLDEFIERIKSCSSGSKLRIRVIGYSSDEPFKKAPPPSTEDHPDSNALNHALAEGRRAQVLKALGFSLPRLTADQPRNPAISGEGSLELVGGDGEPVNALPPYIDISREQFDRLQSILSPVGKTSAAAQPEEVGFYFKGFDELVESRNHPAEGILAVQSIFPRSVVIEILGGGNGTCGTSGSRQ